MAGDLRFALACSNPSTSELSEDDPTKALASSEDAMDRMIGADGDEISDTTSIADDSDIAMRARGDDAVATASMTDCRSMTDVEFSAADDASVSACRSQPISRVTTDLAELVERCASISDDRRTSFFIATAGTAVDSVRLLAIDRNEVRMICAADASESAVRSDAIDLETDSIAPDSDVSTERSVARLTLIARTGCDSAVVDVMFDDSDLDTEARGTLDEDS